MARFSAPEKQAASVMKKLQGTHIKSVGTVRCYEERLTQITTYLQDHRLCSLREMTPTSALQYLEKRSAVVSQKTLDMERQALQKMMRHVTHQLGERETLKVIKSTAKKASPAASGQPNLGRRLSEESRLYTREQVELITARQQPHNALATQIAQAAGLRAHELLSLQRTHRQAPDVRPAHELKFSGIRENSVGYTVHGKGGLTREVRIPLDLVRQLERLRLPEARSVRDRGVNYRQFYDLGGGQSWSQSFGDASREALGWSKGAHALRHGYAQDRMSTMQRSLPREAAKEVVSQELGHFRPEITETYLR
jgi:integrase